MRQFRQFILESKNEGFKAALDYVKGYTTNVNDFLRSGKVLIDKKEIDDAISGLDKCFKDKYDKELYRTVDWSFLKNIFKITKQNLDKHIGDIIEDKGYMSSSKICSSPWGSGWMKDELVLVITSDKPIQCFDVNKNIDAKDIDCEEQEEVLLPRGTKLEIESYETKKDKDCYKDGTWFLYCKIK